MLRRVIPALALVLLLAGCRQTGQSLEGTYDAEGAASSPAQLVLRSDGGGALAVGAEEAPFRWELRGEGQLLLHTRQGGVMLVRRTPQGLELDMPGAGGLVFRKVP